MRKRKGVEDPSGKSKYSKQRRTRTVLIGFIITIILFVFGYVFYLSSTLKATLQTTDEHAKQVEMLLQEISRLKSGKDALEKNMHSLHEKVEEHKESLFQHQDELRKHMDDHKDDEKVVPAPSFHTVVSCGCSAYQNWQVEVLLYSWWKVKQPGHFTRLTAGCKDDEQKRRAQKTAVPAKDRIHYFFTPDYAPPDGTWHRSQKFYFFNKPYGMKELIESGSIKEDVIMLVDPDMIMWKQFLNHLPESGDLHVREGHPVAQLYGIGPKWVDWKLCTTGDCEISHDRAWKHYSVGPPYIMHRNDWKKLVPRWAHYSPGALEKDPWPSILAEMYSFAIAAAELNLPFLVHKDYMLSGPSGMEPWNLADWSLSDGFGTHILHYCQSYWIGKSNDLSSPKKDGFNFHKGHIPRHILEDCDLPLLIDLDDTYSLDDAKRKDKKKDKNNVYMLYWVIRGINQAFRNYKQKFCPNWRDEKGIFLQQPSPWNKNKMWYLNGTTKGGSNPHASEQKND